MQFADKNSKSRRVGLYGQSFLYTLCISKMGSKNSLEKFWLIVRKHVPLQQFYRLAYSSRRGRAS